MRRAKIAEEATEDVFDDLLEHLFEKIGLNIVFKFLLNFISLSLLS